MSSARSKTPSGSTSKRRSGGSTRSDVAFHFPVVYVDESASQEVLPRALRKHDIDVRTRREVFPSQSDVSDVQWLTFCGRQGWIAITKDKEIQHRANERLRSSTRGFAPLFSRAEP